MKEPTSKAEAFAATVAPEPPNQPSVLLDPRLSLRVRESDQGLAASAYAGFSKEAYADGQQEWERLLEFRNAEGKTKRLSRLRNLFDSIPLPPTNAAASHQPIPSTSELSIKNDEIKREEKRKLYTRELWRKCGHTPPSSANTTAASSSVTFPTSFDSSSNVAETTARWLAFEKYAEEKEKELFQLFVQLDRDGDMKLRKSDVSDACKTAGVHLKEGTLDEFVKSLDKTNDGYINFEEFRDCFLLLPRTTSVAELFQFWQTHRLYRPSMSQLTQDGDVVVGRGKSGWNKLLGKPAMLAREKLKELKDAAEATNLRKLEEKHQEKLYAQEVEQKKLLAERRIDTKGKGREIIPESEFAEDDEPEEEVSEGATAGMFSGAGKFLLAGGLAGAVSRTATAPFDRLKVYLITSPTQPLIPPALCPSGSGKTITSRRNAGSIPAAVRAVLKQGGGPKAFWTGNGLNVVKIFPESAIKFLSYESAKRVFAEYVDHVPDQTMISNSSRFISGGIGGVISQLVIYPIETLKTRVMSSTGGSLQGNALIGKIAVDMWKTGGVRLYFKGLTAGLIGVFPYSAIDMSTFEGIKMAYTKWSGSEPGIPGSLAFGACSGGVGATSVYPLNLIRTRLQAQGTPAHPQRYTGVRDAASRCYQLEGWRGFYKGLTPTLVKVVPAVAISWTVYDATKKVLLSREEEERDHEED